MRFQNKFLALLLAVFTVFSCDSEDDVDPTVAGVQNISFKKIMELSPFAGAYSISVSPNEKYMLLAYQENTVIKYYYSNDGGQTVQELKTSADIVETNISNTGLMVIGRGDIYDLENNRNGLGSVSGATGVTDSGKLIYIQNDGTNGKTFFIYNNGVYESTGVQLTMDQGFYLGTSGEKMGFFDSYTKTIAEFDVTAKTFTKTKLTNLDYSQISGNGLSRGKVKTAYSYGHFAYAKEGGVIIITPEHNVRYYDYPADYQIWQNTEGGMKLFGDHAYVNIFDRWGGKKVYVASGTSVEPAGHDFAVCRVGDHVYTQGFLEHGSRFKSGIIKEANGTKSYLPLEYEFQYASNQMFGKTHVLGDYAYVSDKVFNISTKTYATSPIGEIISLYHDEGKTLAYTTTGTFSSTNDHDWIEESIQPMRPEVVTKGIDGVYHALNVVHKVYVSPSTQASTHSVDMEAFTSPDGINWTSVPGSFTDKSGDGPGLIASDGVVLFINNNVGKNTIKYRSEDYGANWSVYANGVFPGSSQLAPEGFLFIREFELKSGKFLSVQFEFNGQLFLTSCPTSSGPCTQLELQPDFNTEGMYQFDDDTTTLTPNDELVFNTLDGIYISSSLD